MNVIEVTRENCQEVADDLILHLIGSELIIVSFYTGKPVIQAPNMIDGVKVNGVCTYQDGKIKIFLSPRRCIFWDVSKEKVTVTYTDHDSVIILRMISETEVLQRVIIKR